MIFIVDLMAHTASSPTGSSDQLFLEVYLVHTISERNVIFADEKILIHYHFHRASIDKLVLAALYKGFTKGLQASCALKVIYLHAANQTQLMVNHRSS